MATRAMLRQISSVLSRCNVAQIAELRGAGFIRPTWATLKGAAVHTQAGHIEDASEGDVTDSQACSSISSGSDPVEASHGLGEESDVKYKAISNLKASSRHDLAMVFTCKVCETRSVKTACRESYEKGIVVVRCGGCNNLHLIADRLGWFGEPGSVEEFLKARGEEVKKGSADSLNMTLDIFGMKS